MLRMTKWAYLLQTNARAMLSVVSRVINVAIMLREAIRYVLVVPLMTYSVMPLWLLNFSKLL